MNPKAQMMSAPGYVKRTRKNVRSAEKRGRNGWVKDAEVSRYISR